MCVWWWPGWGVVVGNKKQGWVLWTQAWVQSRFWGSREVSCLFRPGYGTSREKWKGGALCRPQPPSLALHPFSFSSRFFFPLSPFSPLLFPPLLGRRARIWHFAGPALCHHPAGPRVGNREGQNNKVAVSCLFVHSLASTAPSLEKQVPGFMYPIIIKNLCRGIKQEKVSSTNDYHAEMGVQNIPSFSHSTGIWNSEWASQPVAPCPADRQPIKACQTDKQIK